MIASYEVLDRVTKGIIKLGADFRAAKNLVDRREEWFEAESERLRTEMGRYEQAWQDAEREVRDLKLRLSETTQRAEGAEAKRRTALADLAEMVRPDLARRWMKERSDAY